MVKGGLPEEKTLRLRHRGGAGVGQAKREGGEHSQYREKLVQRPWQQEKEWCFGDAERSQGGQKTEKEAGGVLGK